MVPRERVLTALRHESPDRVPLDFWATPEVWAKLKKHFGTKEEEPILEALHIDIRQFQPPYIGPPLRRFPDGSYLDPMGIHRKPQKTDSCEYEEYASSPLGYAESIADLERYDNWPDPDHFNYNALQGLIGTSRERYYIKLETGGIFEIAWALRGYEQFMMDMVLQPDIAIFIMTKLTDFFCEYVRRALDAAGDKIDMIYTYDDIASQRSLLLSVDHWEQIIKPHHERLNRVIHSYGKTVMYHSCGSVYQMIPYLKALPIDVLNPLQPLAEGMDFRKIKETFGKELSFHGGIDIQFLLPKGTPEEVARRVEETIHILSRDGGYILSSAHYLQADTPVENIITMYETANNYTLR